MAKGFYRDVTKILKKYDWAFHRQAKGSHEIWVSLEGAKVTIPSNLKRRATANDVLRQAQIDEKV